MGYPVRKLSDILTKHNEISKLNPNFYTFILYKHEHKNFRQYILDEFNQLHYLSTRSGAVFFILDNPRDWIQRDDIRYYQDIHGSRYQPELNDEEVDVVCEYFKIHQDSLPAVILFESLQSQSCASISLKELENERDLNDFFGKLFASKNETVNEETAYYGSGAASYLFPPQGARFFPLIETQLMSYNGEKNILKILSEIKQQLTRVENKIDTILEVIRTLQYDIETIKRTRRDEEDKINLIYKKIDRKLSQLKDSLKEDIQDYEDLFRNLIDQWDILEPLSKEMLPLADYLFDQMSRLNNADYSPVILQYCRSLENEIQQKLFIPFTLDIYKKYIKLEEFLMNDLEDEKTKPFAKVITSNRNKKPEEIKFTLGQMIRILDYTAGKRTIKDSPLLQEFKRYIIETFNETNILSKDFLEKVRSFTDKFRNKCAHPYKLNEDEAIHCKELVPQDINDFLRYWKKDIH